MQVIPFNWTSFKYFKENSDSITVAISPRSATEPPTNTLILSEDLAPTSGGAWANYLADIQPEFFYGDFDESSGPGEYKLTVFEKYNAYGVSMRLN